MLILYPEEKTKKNLKSGEVVEGASKSSLRSQALRE